MFFIILKTFFIDILLPVSLQVVKTYVKSTDSKNDDKILEASKICVEYLAEKTNNNVSTVIANELKDNKMIFIQGGT